MNLAVFMILNFVTCSKFKLNYQHHALYFFVKLLKISFVISCAKLNTRIIYWHWPTTVKNNQWNEIFNLHMNYTGCFSIVCLWAPHIIWMWTNWNVKISIFFLKKYEMQYLIKMQLIHGKCFMNYLRFDEFKTGWKEMQRK